uniref:Hypothetical intron-encoded HNH endonuclease n=1 Tax=Pediastrum duplex TaxID=3105 RepID=A0A344PFI1_PEDDU|nr:hypothetical intron-encoded HNH endonuclease [Pediastrum duplex]
MSSINNIAWSDIRWFPVNQYVHRLQHRIYKASLNKNVKLVHLLQKRLLSSFEARLYATRLVTTLNKGKRTAGVDRIKITSGEQKLQLAKTLRINGKAQPIRRVWIPKPGKSEMRPLGIPTIRDRAKQALVKLALEPQWEAAFEANSYGFRPGRCAHDAIEAIFLNLRHDRPKWVFDADIRKCFDRISHKALLAKLDTYPQLEKQIKAWLEAGVMEGYANTPKEIEAVKLGTPQGGVISPLLANIALHGLEEHLKNFVTKIPGLPYPGANRGKVAKHKALGFARYADDFVVIHANKEILLLCIDECKNWLERIGLEISEEKSALRDAREGFKFLGFQIILVRKKKADRYKVKITPSKANQLRFLTRVRGIIQSNRSISSFNLILMLRPVILGWANYFRYCECKDTFSVLTHRIYFKLRAWVFRRDTRNGRKAIKKKYFPAGRTYIFNGRKYKDNWILVGKMKGKDGKIVENYLPHMSWVKSEKFVKIKGAESPFARNEYWMGRFSKGISMSSRVKTLFTRQRKKCAICNNQFSLLDMQTWQVDHIIPKKEGGPDTYANLRLLCRSCYDQKSAKEKGKSS